MSEKKYSPSLLKYLSAYEANPFGKAFAPLAETYLKLGMYDEAFKVLKKGIKNHPQYALGQLVLAQYYEALGKIDLAYQILKPLAPKYLDNLFLQKLFAKVAQKVGAFAEALESYKYLLFLNPKDASLAERVRTLEEELEPRSEAVIRSGEKAISFHEDDWEQVTLSPEPSAVISHWDEIPFAELKKTPIKNSKEKSKKVDAVLKKEEPPIVTHTLIDLYCAQKHYSKAKEVLEKIISLNPSDEKSISKLREVEKKMMESESKEKASPQEKLQDKLQNKFEIFLEKIDKRSKSF
ncbi:MAG: hypothetical protein KBD63_02595 [Bacteriovoracaceae bacterium]|nr:hypothetical protein [Bacteriovoracaceae bacterium]